MVVFNRNQVGDGPVKLPNLSLRYRASVALLTGVRNRHIQHRRLESAAGKRSDQLRDVLDDAQKERFAARIYEVTKERLNTRVYACDANGTVLFDSDGGKDEGKDYSKWNDVYLTLQGKYGAPPAEVNAAVRQKAIGNEDVITCRPADLLQPEMNRLRDEIRDTAQSDEDVLIYAMFPDIGREFLEQRRDDMLVPEKVM